MTALTAWGNSSHTNSELLSAATGDDVRAWLATTRNELGARGVIARGHGRSYGDQCLNNEGRVIQTLALNQIRAFDRDTGVLVCDAGGSFADIMQHCLPHGWMPAVCPGTAIVTMGGALANDVHGKNQHHAGTFTDHVDWFDLALPDGTLERVTRASNPALFDATSGGIGLTGVILALQVRLRRIRSNALQLTETRVANLASFLEQLPNASVANEYAVGWIDGLKSGGVMGRGVLETAMTLDADVSAPPQRSLNWPVQTPPFVLNRFSVGAFNALYYHRIPQTGRRRTIHVNKFLYPLDAVLNWNRLYGKPGVYQFQCGMPLDSAREGLTRVMAEATRSRSASFLAVIKYMGRNGTGALSFTMPGFSLALDFPRRPDTFALMRRLHEIVKEFGGRVYLAKDACITAADFRAMYPRHAEFHTFLRRIDPDARMQSDMSRRLGLHAALPA
ncbi:MAG: FAD-binding protein [Gemmatimonas sp.]